MTIQNKYKARASRRYKVAHNMLPSQEEKKAQEASSKLPKTSNDWRYVETDSEAEEDTEREPEVDLTGFNARVAAIDLNSQTQAQAPESDSDEDEEAWQEQARQKELAQVDWEEMKREKESAEAARELKERFERQPQGLAGAAQWRRAVNRPPAARQRFVQPATATGESKLDRDVTSYPSVRVATRAPAATARGKAQDIDEFLASIDESEVAPTPGPSAAPTQTNQPKDLEGFLDNVLG